MKNPRLLTEWTAKRREQGLPEYHVGTGQDARTGGRGGWVMVAKFLETWLKKLWFMLDIT